MLLSCHPCLARRSFILTIVAALVSACGNNARHDHAAADPEVVHQTKRNTCGPAALAMLLTSIGRPATEAVLEREMSPGPDGVTLTSIVTAAASRGVQLEAWRVRPDTLGFLRTPAILWIDGDHFVVFDSLTSEGASVRDPSTGRLILPVESLWKRWDGTAALLAGPP